MKTTDLSELQKMQLVKSDKDGSRYPLSFEDRGDDNRKIVLEVNSQRPVDLVLCYPDDTTQFLKTVEGRERVTFYLRGAAELWAADPADPSHQLWWWCSEMEYFDTKLSDIPTEKAGTFTVIRERRGRNSELDKIMKLSAYNTQKRERRMMRELEAMKAEIRAGKQLPPEKDKLSDEQKAEVERQKAEKEAADKAAADEKKKKPEKDKAENA